MQNDGKTILQKQINEKISGKEELLRLHTVIGNVQQLTKKKIGLTLRRIKNGGAIGPNKIPV